MATDKRNLEESNKSEWRDETKEVGLRLDNLVETAEGNPYAYILIAVEKESDGTNVGIQVNGGGLLLAQGLASFLAKDDYAPLIQMANYLAALGLMDEPNEVPDELSNEVTTFQRSIFGNK